MKKTYRCQICRYLVKSTEAPALCPACGIKGKIFEEFESSVSEERRKRIDLHLHPVAVRFPVAFTTSMFLLSVLRIAELIEEHAVFTGMSDALVWILPFAAVSATLAGMYDGRLRFKRLGTPIQRVDLRGSAVLIAGKKDSLCFPARHAASVPPVPPVM